MYGRPPAAPGSAAALLATLAEHLRRPRLPPSGLVGAALEPGPRVLPRLGAAAMDEWVPYRLTGTALTDVAASAGT